MASSVAWGLDVGNRALKAVKLVREGDGVRIDDFDVVEHENILSNAGDNREALIQTALATFAGRHNIKNTPVAVGVSGQQSFARFVKLPPVEPNKIPEIVRFEAIQQIPFPLDEVEWSYQLFKSEASPDVEVGVFAMRKDLVQQHMNFFTSAGMNVELVQMNPLAVYNALRRDGRLDGTTMIIDLGSENADLIITEGESIWMRSIPIGGNNFTEALGKQFQLRFEKAEELKRNAATSKYGRQILQAMRPIFADLVSEIQRSIGFYSSVHRDSRISKVLALGGTFNLPGLQKYLQQNLGLDVTKVDSLGSAPPTDPKVATTLNENILSSVSAYGLALQGLGLETISSSLLPTHIRRERAWKHKTKWFAAAAACFVVGTGLGIARYQMEEIKFTQAQPTYDKNKSTVSMAKGLSDQWGAVEKRGEPDRKRLADVNSLTQFREVWPSILSDLTAAVPDPKTARNKNERMFLEDFHVEYHPDMGPVLAGPDSQFNSFAAARDWNAGNPLVKKAGAMPGMTTPGFAPPVIGAPSPLGGPQGDRLMAPGAARPGMPPMPNMNPGPGGTDAAAAPAGPRGFVITLHLATSAPDASAIGLIERVIRDKLLERDKMIEVQASKAGIPRPYKIERVTVPVFVQFDKDQGRIAALTQRAQQFADRKAKAEGLVSQSGSGTNGALFAPGVGVGAGEMRGYQPPIAPVMPQPGMIPGVPGVGPGGVTAPPVNIFLDPLTNEDQRNWSDVTVLVAVSVDPTLVPAPAEGQPGTPAPSGEPQQPL